MPTRASGQYLTVLRAGTADRLSRNDGHTWNGTNAGDSAFAIGQQVTISGEWSFPSLVFARNSAGDTITRTDVGNWISDGFAAGQTIWLSGTTSTNGSLTNNGSFTIKSVGADGKTLTVLTCPSLEDETYRQDDVHNDEDLAERWTPRFRR